MALVTSAEVKAIYPTDADVAPFIEVADLLVQEELSGSGLSDARKKQVELYLAAHFAAVTIEKGGIIRKKIGDSEEYYATYKNDLVGLSSTTYGQQAITLDSSGTLGSLTTKSVKAQFRIVQSNC